VLVWQISRFWGISKTDDPGISQHRFEFPLIWHGVGGFMTNSSSLLSSLFSTSNNPVWYTPHRPGTSACGQTAIANADANKTVAEGVPGRARERAARLAVEDAVGVNVSVIRFRSN